MLNINFKYLFTTALVSSSLAYAQFVVPTAPMDVSSYISAIQNPDDRLSPDVDTLEYITQDRVISNISWPANLRSEEIRTKVLKGTAFQSNGSEYVVFQKNGTNWLKVGLNDNRSETLIGWSIQNTNGKPIATNGSEHVVLDYLKPKLLSSEGKQWCMYVMSPYDNQRFDWLAVRADTINGSCS